ncbi:hypothetical protein ACSDQ9_07905 [Aestuariimicrobium soli]|uniref:hypothetical protein n=1 Tax=Aestuariimicrobium soli TaxID=2035834 RepID=UPI003EBB9A1A
MDTYLLHGGMHPGFGSMHHGPGLFGLILPALFFLALAVAAVVLVTKGRVGPIRWLGRHRDASPVTGWSASRPAEDAAFETLKMRLATGDITPEEFLERSSVLRSPGAANGKADQ